MKKGYGICFNEWLEDSRIKNELRLLIKIASLTADKGYCYASNEFFSEYFDMTTISASRQISKLIKLGYIKAEYDKQGSQVKRRYLRLTRMLTGGYQKCSSTVNKNVKDNNTSNNNTSSSIKGKPKKRFSKPTAEQINDYLKQTNNDNLIDADAFIDYYQAKDWMIGSNRMKDWKAAVRTWLRRETKTSTQTKSKTNIKSEIFDRISKGYDGTHQWKSPEAKKVFEQMRTKSSGVPWTGNEWQINQAISEAL